MPIHASFWYLESLSVWSNCEVSKPLLVTEQGSFILLIFRSSLYTTDNKSLSDTTRIAKIFTQCQFFTLSVIYFDAQMLSLILSILILPFMVKGFYASVEKSLLTICHKDILICLILKVYCFICHIYFHNPTKIDIYEYCDLGIQFSPQRIRLTVY